MKAVESKLSNGLTVVYLQMPSVQKFRLMLHVPVGAAHDPAGKEGLSHILEHTIFCGTSSLNEQEFSNRIRSAGGWYNACTSNDFTRFELTASTKDPENFLMICDAMRQMMTEPVFCPDDRIEREKQIIINERSDKIDNLEYHPMEALAEGMHVGNKPPIDIIGTEESILSVYPEDLKRFMGQYYDAGHMILFACAPLDSCAALDVLESTLSAIPNLRRDPEQKYVISTRSADVRSPRKDLRQNYTVMMFEYPYKNDVREGIISSEAGKHIGQMLTEVLRREYGCFYNLSFGGWTKDEKTQQSVISMSTRPDHAEKACYGIMAFAGNIEKYLTDENLQASLDEWIYGLENPERIDEGILDAVRYEYERSHLFDREKEIEILKSISPDEIRQQARRILSSLKGMYVQGPEPERAPSLQSLMEALPKLEEPLVAAPNTAPRLIVQ
jgi:predicted Zn-dependent peptidase